MKRTLAVMFVGLATAAAAFADGKYPGNEAGLKQFLTDVLTSPDAKGMTRTLKPTADDYAAVFTADFAKTAAAKYEQLWQDPRAVIAAKPDQTEVTVWHATTEELQKHTGAAGEFPGGYKRVADKMKPGVVWYGWRYTKKGEELGMAYDGVAFVNGHWAWFPKPWKVDDK